MRQATLERPHPAGLGGVQKLFRFSNGYGASVVQPPHSYGGDEGDWELVVTRYTGEKIDSFSLAYDTPITEDVLGYLSEQEVDDVLTQIEALDAPNTQQKEQ
jgi:hypothetical protein